MRRNDNLSVDTCVDIMEEHYDVTREDAGMAVREAMRFYDYTDITQHNADNVIQRALEQVKK